MNEKKLTQGSLSKDDISRYSRQLLLREIGIDGQVRLRQSSVLVVGAGGLGCPVVQYLAASGLGCIGIIDSDRVDISNIHRQTIFTEYDCDEYKAEKAMAYIKARNSGCQVNCYTEFLTDHNAQQIIDKHEIVIDCTDNFSVRYLINDVCVKLGKPLVSGAIQKFSGQIGVYNIERENGDRGPCFRCVFPEVPPAGLIQNCEEAGVIGALPGIIGAMQSLEAIKLIIGAESGIHAKIFEFNALTYNTKKYSIRKSSSCPVCSKDADEIALEYDFYSCGTDDPSNDIPDLEPDKIKALIDQNRISLIDVRPRHEHEIANIGGRIIEMQDVNANKEYLLSESKKYDHLVIYCKTGKRSLNFAKHIKENLGIDNVVRLKGGVTRWAQEIDNSMPIY
ncbi:molybdopterin-synthase adenylyltransferase MoeB [Marinimicrobium locisalis]|uniref:molybdopterin-synthase adenylyltransferase MoeB n=1 Tax=Marinimicrobium locisalis TaxID=546022 RepID=UPI0032219CF2